MWFYRLFRTSGPLAASGIAAFGLVNAVAILVSAALLATAVELALDPVGDAAATVQLLYLVSGNLWGVGALFFGLWLIPMGWCVLRSGWMPRALGWILIGGGAGYLLSAFIRYLAPDAAVVADALAYPATVGEFWMVGYLLVRRRPPPGTGRSTANRAHADAGGELTVAGATQHRSGAPPADINAGPRCRSSALPGCYRSRPNPQLDTDRPNTRQSPALPPSSGDTPKAGRPI